MHLQDEGAQKLVAEPRGCHGEIDDQDLGAELGAEMRVGQQRCAVQLEAVADIYLPNPDSTVPLVIFSDTVCKA